MQSPENLHGEREVGTLRSDFRVSVPDDFLKACAVWFRSDFARNDRLPLDQLGRPEVVTRRPGDPAIRIQDISIRGMRLLLRVAAKRRAALLAPGGVFVYFKLLDPQGLTPSRRLSMFLGGLIVNSEDLGDDLALGLRFVSNILPTPDERSFTFFHVKQYGVAELGRWCDAINRMRRVGAPVERAESPGLSLENLLDEIDRQEEG